MFETIPITHLTEKQRKGFSCGVEELDDYFKRFSKNNHLKNIGKTFVLLEDDLVIGYYTTSMGNIDFNSLPINYTIKIPKYPVPVARIGRLAVNIKKQGQGWGQFLLVDGLKKIVEANSLVATHGVIVDAKDENAKRFYTKYGFIPLKDRDLCLFLPITSIPLLR